MFFSNLQLRIIMQLHLINCKLNINTGLHQCRDMYWYCRPVSVMAMGSGVINYEHILILSVSHHRQHAGGRSHRGGRRKLNLNGN